VAYHEGNNDRMGFGRVNALNAVKAVLQQAKANKTTIIKKSNKKTSVKHRL